MSTREQTKRPYRIALVITELEVGGAERCLTNVALRIDKSRFNPVVYSLGPRPSNEKGGLVAELESAGIPIHFLGAKSLFDAWSAFRDLKKLLTEQNPDLVQTFLFHANVLGSQAAKAAGVRHIVSGIRVADPSRWRHMVERHAAGNVERIVCVSESVAKFSRETAKLPAEKICVIPNGIDVSLFLHKPAVDPIRPPVAAGRRVMVVVGRLHSQKGIDWLLEAIPKLFDSFPDVDLAIVGRGAAESELQSLTNRLGLNSRVHFLGWRNDVPSILGSSDLFVLPSRWEGMANALLEAMASGLPVVCTRVQGAEELIGRFAEGQIIEFGDSQRLVDSIASTLSEPVRAKELGKLNRKRAEQFSLDRVVGNYEELYLGLLEGPRTAGEFSGNS